MKIAFAIEHYRPEQGGAEQYASGLAAWLIGQGHSVDVFTRDAGHAVSAAVTLHRLDVPDHPRSTRPARFAAALTAALDGKTYDVVHAFNHAWPGDVLRLGGGVHLAFETYNAMSGGSTFERALKRLSYAILPQYRALRDNEVRQFADSHRRFIAISERVAKDMRTFYPDCRERIHVIHNGVDPTLFNPELAAARRSPSRARLGLAEQDLTLLFISNNYRLKGLQDLIRAMPAVLRRMDRPVRLLVVGRGKARPFEALADRTGVRESVRFCGHTDTLLDDYAAADVLVHPSYYDAFGFVCLEAAACGLPVVVSRNSGVSEVLSGKGAILIDMPCGRDRLVEAVVEAASPEFRRRAAQQNPALAREHSLEHNYEAVLRLYEQVAEEKKTRRAAPR